MKFCRRKLVKVCWLKIKLGKNCFIVWWLIVFMMVCVIMLKKCRICWKKFLIVCILMKSGMVMYVLIWFMLIIMLCVVNLVIIMVLLFLLFILFINCWMCCYRFFIFMYVKVVGWLIFFVLIRFIWCMLLFFCCMLFVYLMMWWCWWWMVIVVCYWYRKWLMKWLIFVRWWCGYIKSLLLMVVGFLNCGIKKLLLIYKLVKFMILLMY